MKRSQTKLQDIAAKVIEGGQSERAKWKRKKAQRQERTRTRSALDAPRGDFESDRFVCAPYREKVYKEFADRTAFLRRWLRSHLGESWNDIHSKIKRELNTNSLRGRHLWNDHLDRIVYKDLVVANNWKQFSRSVFYTENGILCEWKSPAKKRSIRGRINKRLISSFLKGRCLRKIGNQLFWFHHMDGRSYSIRIVGSRNYEQLAYFYSFQKPITNPLGEIVNYEVVTVSNGYQGHSHSMDQLIPREELSTKQFYEKHNRFPRFMYVKQGNKLSKNELDIWNRIPECYQILILNYNP